MDVLHAWTICHKKLDKECPNFKKIVRDTTTECRIEAIRRHMFYASMLHSINLLRWYGEIRNSGVYNKDCVFGVFEIISKLHEEYNLIEARFKKLKFPTIA